MKLRKLLYPFSLVYDGVTRVRNTAYDRGWKESTLYDLPVICIGNLSVGGTGKSPMVEWMLSFLLQDYRVAVLSRGYGRSTKGYLEVEVDHQAHEVGDEPLQIKNKYPKALVAVCADRRSGIARLRDRAEVILLDDAFQHRKVRPSFTVLLTPYDDLFLDDTVLPAGNLREATYNRRRADLIVVTKCPDPVPYAKLQEIQFRMGLQEHQKIYFTRISYHKQILGKTESLPLSYLKGKTFTLVTGIAKPGPLVAYLEQQGFDFEYLRFPDHHRFSDQEIAQIEQKDLVLTSEKDYMRLRDRTEKFALYYLPIGVQVLNEQEPYFRETILQHIQAFRKA